MNKFVRYFSEAALNRVSKFKANELSIHLEKFVKQYIKDNLNKHTNNITKINYENEKQITKILNEHEHKIMQYIDTKNREEFWKILSISLTGFGSLVGLNFIIKNELKDEIKGNKKELKYDIQNIKIEIKDDINNFKNETNKKIEKLEHKLDRLENKIDILISRKR